MSDYRTRVFLVVVILILTSFNTPAKAAVSADCIEFSNPRSTTGTTSITLEVDLYSICSKVIREYDRPVYGMVEEDSLLNLSSCSGPSIKSAGTLGKMSLGSISCNLRINQNLGSPRVGSTSTTIKVWFAWDFSTKVIRITHSPIPSTIKVTAPTPVPTIPIYPQPTQTPTPAPTSSELTSLTSLAASVASLRALIVTLTNLVLKIQKTVKD